jgi:hypothetical protein
MPTQPAGAAGYGTAYSSRHEYIRFAPSWQQYLEESAEYAKPSVTKSPSRPFQRHVLTIVAKPVVYALDVCRRRRRR